MMGGQRHVPAPLLPWNRSDAHFTQQGTGAENLAPAGIRFLYRSSRSEFLYQLSYPGPPVWVIN
jgi:hypothetical protein